MSIQYSPRVGLFCNARNEKHIREWVTHHLLIGFDHVVIFDHLSSPSIQSMFDKGYQHNRLTLIRIDQETFVPSVKLHLMDRAIEIAKQMRFDWFMYLDADEFVTMSHKIPNSIKYIIRMCDAHMDSIAFNWLFFGSNKLIEDPNDLMISSYLRSELVLNQHTKALVRTSQALNAINPHFYVLKNGNYGCLSGTLEPDRIFCKTSLPYYQVPAYVAHFVVQSEETFTNRRVNKQKDDGSQPISSLPENFHNLHDEGNNYQLQKYVPKIKQILGSYGYLF